MWLNTINSFHVESELLLQTAVVPLTIQQATVNTMFVVATWAQQQIDFIHEQCCGDWGTTTHAVSNRTHRHSASLECTWRGSHNWEPNMLLWEGMQNYSPYFLRSYGDEPLVPMCERENLRARKSIVVLILQWNARAWRRIHQRHNHNCRGTCSHATIPSTKGMLGRTSPNCRALGLMQWMHWASWQRLLPVSESKGLMPHTWP